MIEWTVADEGSGFRLYTKKKRDCSTKYTIAMYPAMDQSTIDEILPYWEAAKVKALWVADNVPKTNVIMVVGLLLMAVLKHLSSSVSTLPRPSISRAVELTSGYRNGRRPVFERKRKAFCSSHRLSPWRSLTGRLQSHCGYGLISRGTT